MRTEHTESMTTTGVSLSGVVADDTLTPSLSAHPARLNHHSGGDPVPRGDHHTSAEVDGWKVDEHWTAVTAYLADLYLPDEG